MRSKWWFVIVVLLLTGLACRVGGGDAPSPQEVATSVAATLDAFNPPTGSAPTVEVKSEPTSLPEPTLPPPTLTRALGTDVGGNLWFWQEGASSRQLSFSGGVTDHVLSPDASTVVYQRSPDYTTASLWAVNADGSGERQLLSETDLAAIGAVNGSIGVGAIYLAWVPGTRSVAFATSPRFEGPGLMVNDDLQLLNVDSGERTQLLPRGEGGRFAYAPDGSQIAISTPVNIHLVNADGSNWRANVITFPFINTASEYAYYPYFTWAQDSSYVLTAIPPQDPWTTPVGNTTIWRVAVDGSPAQVMSTVPADLFNEVKFSPEGARMLYTTRVGDQVELHQANLDGSGDTPVALGTNLRIADWNPAGSHFLFSMEGSDAQVVQPGSPPVLLPGTMAAGRAVHWKQDGSVLYVLGSGPYEVRQRTLDGADSSLVVGLPFPPKFLP